MITFPESNTDQPSLVIYSLDQRKKSREAISPLHVLFAWSFRLICLKQFSILLSINETLIFLTIWQFQGVPTSFSYIIQLFVSFNNYQIHARLLQTLSMNARNLSIPFLSIVAIMHSAWMNAHSNMIVQRLWRGKEVVTISSLSWLLWASFLGTLPYSEMGRFNFA